MPHLLGSPNTMALAAVLCIASLAACTVQHEDAQNIAASCTPNQPNACGCADGSTSMQLCSADGLSYGPCACAAPGTAGVGGGSGTGAAGSAGMAGTSGNPMADAGVQSSADAAADVDASPAVDAGADATVNTTDDVPMSDHCAPVANWEPAWSQFEEEVLLLVNENRAKGWNCDSEGAFPPAGPMTMNPYLRCSARLHSKDMNDRQYFDHTNPDGDGPGERVDATGYKSNTWGENIAMGQQTPEEVVAGWMDSDGHCANIMHAEFNELGVGFVKGTQTNMFYNDQMYWTQNFGAVCTSQWCK